VAEFPSTSAVGVNGNGYYHPSGGSPESAHSDVDAEGEDEPTDAQPQPAPVHDAEEPSDAEEGSDSRQRLRIRR
jgi:hypothetical protein